MIASEPLCRLRKTWIPWFVFALMPIPLLILLNPQDRGELGCLYFGIACAFLAVVFIRSHGGVSSIADWWSRIFLIAIACAINLAIFISAGIACNVKTNLPFPIMAALSTVPSLGLVPGRPPKPRKPLPAMVFAAALVL